MEQIVSPQNNLFRHGTHCFAGKHTVSPQNILFRHRTNCFGAKQFVSPRCGSPRSRIDLGQTFFIGVMVLIAGLAGWWLGNSVED
jgi:hypothetical protein